ncbi:MAG: thioesterase family protein [Sandaracinaceae bacterium]|nr:thioesterase family protein [Sandaracinaceae bacterium]
MTEMSHELDRDTASQEVSREGTQIAFDTHVSGAWSIGSAPNGGYLTVLVARAMASVLAVPDPFTITTHFLRVAVPGPARIEIEIVRQGRGHATAMGRLVQAGGEVSRTLATFGDFASLSGPTLVRAVAPRLPPREACDEGRAGPTTDLSIADRVEMRMAPGTVSWPSGIKNDDATLAGWARLRDGRPTDALSLLFFADAFPPPVLNLEVAHARWVPTLELTIHLRARPAPGWVQAVFRTRALVGGYLEEDGEIFDETGALVAMSRQLARLHR